MQESLQESVCRKWLKKMFERITPDWPAPPNVHSLFAPGINLATQVSDDPHRIGYNRNLVGRDMPGEPVWLRQIHSNQVIMVNGEPVPASTTADASYSETIGRVLVIMVADCLPILLCSTDGQAIAAIHAGWRGLATGIIGRCLDMARHQQPPGWQREWLAWLGPAIGPCHYEVGADVRDQFDCGLTPGATQGKWQLDLYEVAIRQLQAAGVDQIYGGGFCTYCDMRSDMLCKMGGETGDKQPGAGSGDRAKFFSFRRDGETGRMGAFIWRSATLP